MISPQHIQKVITLENINGVSQGKG